MTVRVLIADDHELTRAGLRAVIEREPDLEVVAEVSTAEAAIARAAKGDIDLAVLDVRFGAGMNGLEAAEVIVAGGHARVLILTLHDSAEYVRSALAAGATGFVMKDAARVELLDAIRSVCAGRTAMPAVLLRKALESRLDSREDDLARLTPREREVLDRIALGLTNKAIARELGIGPGTVKAHVEKVIAKLGVADRTQAAVLAARANR